MFKGSAKKRKQSDHKKGPDDNVAGEDEPAAISPTSADKKTLALATGSSGHRNPSTASGSDQGEGHCEDIDTVESGRSKKKWLGGSSKKKEKIEKEYAAQLEKEKRTIHEQNDKWKREEMEKWKAEETTKLKELQAEVAATMEAKQKLEQEKKEELGRNDIMLKLALKDVQEKTNLLGEKEAEIEELKNLLKEKADLLGEKAEELKKVESATTLKYQTLLDDLQKQIRDFSEEQQAQKDKVEEVEKQLVAEQNLHQQEKNDLMREHKMELEKKVAEEKGRHHQEKEALVKEQQKHLEKEVEEEKSRQQESYRKHEKELEMKLKSERNQHKQEKEGLVQECKKHLDEVAEEKQRHQQERDYFRKQLEELQAELKEEKDRHEQEKENLDAKHQELAQEKWSQEAKEKLAQQQATQELEELARQLKESDRKAAEFAANLEKLREENDKVKGELDEARQNVAKVTEEKFTLAAQLEGAKREGERMEGDLKEIRQNLQVEKDEKNEFATKLAEAKTKAETVQGELGNIQIAQEKLVNELKEEREMRKEKQRKGEDQLQRHNKELERLKRKLEDEKIKVQQLTQVLEQTLSTSEEGTMKSLREEDMSPLATASTLDPGLTELKAKLTFLEEQNKEFKAQQFENPVPSNVIQFAQQLSKLVAPQGVSAPTTPRPLTVDITSQALQLLQIGSADFKSRSYVLALFIAHNSNQSVLLDYTRIGEVVQFRGQDPASDSENERSSLSSMNDSKSPYTSLTEVKVEVTDGNMTDADKLELQSMLLESQKELENLRSEKDSLLGHIAVLEEQFHLSDARIAKGASADGAKSTPDQEKKSEADKLQQMKRSYLKVHNEKLQLQEKVEERDAQLKQLRAGYRKADGAPPVDDEVKQLPSIEDRSSPKDPRAEVDRLRAVISEKDQTIYNMGVQLRSIPELAGDVDQIKKLKKECENYREEITKLKSVQEANEEQITSLKEKLQSSEAVKADATDQNEQITWLKGELQIAKAEIKKLKDTNASTQVYSSLKQELASTRAQLKNAEHEKQDLELTWSGEIAAEKSTNQKLKCEIARLQTAVKYWEMKQPAVAAGDEITEESFHKEREFLDHMHQIEVADYQNKILAKDAAIQSLDASRKSLETRLLRIKQERDGLVDQNHVLLAAKANLLGELSQFDDVKHSVEGLKDFAVKLRRSLTLKSTEVESLKGEKEAMNKEIQSLKDEIEAWKQEVAIIKEDFALERHDREEYASRRDSETGRWNVEKQQYDAQIKYLNHQLEQQDFQLTAKLDEMKARYQEALKCQTETDEQMDNLREERDMFRSEQHRISEMYEEQKKHREQLSAHINNLQEKLQLADAEKRSIQEELARLQDERRKNVKVHELTAAMTRELKVEKEQLMQKLHAVDQQKQHYFSQWKQEERKLEEQIAMASRVSDDLSAVSQELTHQKTQTDHYKAKFQEEKKRARLFEQEMNRLEEGHREEVDFIKAQHEDKILNQERLMMPLKRELEHLRARTYSEGKYAETFRRMEEEKKEMMSLIESLQAKNSALLEDFTMARKLLIEKNLPLPKRQDVSREPGGSEFDVRPYIAPASDGNPVPLHRLDDYGARESFKAYSTQLVRSSDAQQQIGAQQGEITAPSSQAVHPNQQQQFPKNRGSFSVESASRGQDQYGNSPTPVMRAGVTQPGGSNNDARQGGGQRQPGLPQKKGQLQPGDAYRPQHSPPSPHPHHQQPPAPQQVPPSTAAHDPPVRAMGRDPQGQQGYQPNPSQAVANTRPPNPSGPQENPLIKGIDADIQQAAANLQQGPSMESINPNEEAWPLDSNLICPMCKKQFRIGQIQYYKQHVDKCKGT